MNLKNIGLIKKFVEKKEKISDRIALNKFGWENIWHYCVCIIYMYTFKVPIYMMPLHRCFTMMDVTKDDDLNRQFRDLRQSVVDTQLIPQYLAPKRTGSNDPIHVVGFSIWPVFVSLFTSIMIRPSRLNNKLFQTAITKGWHNRPILVLFHYSARVLTDALTVLYFCNSKALLIAIGFAMLR